MRSVIHVCFSSHKKNLSILVVTYLTVDQNLVPRYCIYIYVYLYIYDPTTATAYISLQLIDIISVNI